MEMHVDPTCAAHTTSLGSKRPREEADPLVRECSSSRLSQRFCDDPASLTVEDSLTLTHRPRYTLRGVAPMVGREELRFSVLGLKLGRDAALSEVVLDSAGISRLHCAISVVGEDGVWVHDKSSNGTFVNGRRVGRGRHAALQHGDMVSFLNPLLPEAPHYTYILELPEDLLLAQARHSHWKSELLAGHPNSRYQLGPIIGHGSFAVVRYGTNTSTGEPVAVKLLEKRRFFSEVAVASLRSEAEMMRGLRHPNIVRVLDTFEAPDGLALVMEYVGGGDLFDYIIARGPRPFTEVEVRELFVQLLEAVLYIHHRKIVHCDLKPENILIEVLDGATRSDEEDACRRSGGSGGGGGVGSDVGGGWSRSSGGSEREVVSAAPSATPPPPPTAAVSTTSMAMWANNGEDAAGSAAVAASPEKGEEEEEEGRKTSEMDGPPPLLVDPATLRPSQIRLKLTDFGISKYRGELPGMGGDDSGVAAAGTPAYAAPEMLAPPPPAQAQGGKSENDDGRTPAARHFTSSMDVWSLGVLLYVLSSGCLPKRAQTSERVCITRYMAECFSADFLHLLQLMMKIAPDERPTLAAVCSHPWLSDAHIMGRMYVEEEEEEDLLSVTTSLSPRFGRSCRASGTTTGGQQAYRAPHGFSCTSSANYPYSGTASLVPSPRKGERPSDRMD